jgi:transcriptional regulator with XRE-family HTH domain
MKAARLLKTARRRAGLSQRELADAAGVAQPAIARIESGRVRPRVDTLDRLLEACGSDLEVAPRLGIGIDRTVIRRLLRLTPMERLDLAVADARGLERILR